MQYWPARIPILFYGNSLYNRDQSLSLKKEEGTKIKYISKAAADAGMQVGARSDVQVKWKAYIRLLENIKAEGNS